MMTSTDNASGIGIPLVEKGRDTSRLSSLQCTRINSKKIYVFAVFFTIVGFQYKMVIAATIPKVWPIKPSGAAVEVVYPREPNADGKFPLRYGIDSTFLLGNVAEPLHTKLTINNRPVAIDSNGGWLAWLRCPSIHDDFVWHLQAVTGTQVFNLDVPVSRFRMPPPLVIRNFPKPFWVFTKEGARFRGSPQGKNILLPMSNTPVRIHAQLDAAYGARLPDGTTVWMDTGKVVAIKQPPKLVTVKVVTSQYDSVSRETIVTFVSGAPSPFRIGWEGDSYCMRLYFMRFKAFRHPTTHFDSNSVLSSIRIVSQGEGCLIDVFFKPNIWLIGYYFSDDDEGLHLHLRQAPSDAKMPTKPLSRWKIVVDPGHGGTEYGAIGPTWLSEKNVNLAVATR